MTNHTPTPWNVRYYDEFQNAPLDVLSSEGNCIANVGRRSVNKTTGKVYEPSAEAFANAAFIVKAVNCHQELVDAAKAVLDNLREGDFISTTRLDALQAAIAKAKGE